MQAINKKSEQFSYQKLRIRNKVVKNSNNTLAELIKQNKRPKNKGKAQSQNNSFSFRQLHLQQQKEGRLFSSDPLIINSQKSIQKLRQKRMIPIANNPIMGKMINSYSLFQLQNQSSPCINMGVVTIRPKSNREKRHLIVKSYQQCQVIKMNNNKSINNNSNHNNNINNNSSNLQQSQVTNKSIMEINDSHRLMQQSKIIDKSSSSIVTMSGQNIIMSNKSLEQQQLQDLLSPLDITASLLISSSQASTVQSRATDHVANLKLLAQNNTAAQTQVTKQSFSRQQIYEQKLQQINKLLNELKTFIKRELNIRMKQMYDIFREGNKKSIELIMAIVRKLEDENRRLKMVDAENVKLREQLMKYQCKYKQEEDNNDDIINLGREIQKSNSQQQGMNVIVESQLVMINRQKQQQEYHRYKKQQKYQSQYQSQSPIKQIQTSTIQQQTNSRSFIISRHQHQRYMLQTIEEQNYQQQEQYQQTHQQYQQNYNNNHNSNKNKNHNENSYDTSNRKIVINPFEIFDTISCNSNKKSAIGCYQRTNKSINLINVDNGRQHERDTNYHNENNNNDRTIIRDQHNVGKQQIKIYQQNEQQEQIMTTSKIVNKILKLKHHNQLHKPHHYYQNQSQSQINQHHKRLQRKYNHNHHDNQQQLSHQQQPLIITQQQSISFALSILKQHNRINQSQEQKQEQIHSIHNKNQQLYDKNGRKQFVNTFQDQNYCCSNKIKNNNNSNKLHKLNNKQNIYNKLITIKTTQNKQQSNKNPITITNIPTTTPCIKQNKIKQILSRSISYNSNNNNNNLIIKHNNNNQNNLSNNNYYVKVLPLHQSIHHQQQQHQNNSNKLY